MEMMKYPEGEQREIMTGRKHRDGEKEKIKKGGERRMNGMKQREDGKK
jgi:hypothetical protein